MNQPRRAERPDVGVAWRPSDCNGVVGFRARFERQHFPRHTHDVYVIGVNEAGAHTTWHRGGRHVVSAGQLAVICPGEVHTGEPVPGLPWHYRALYVTPQAMRGLFPSRPSAGEPRFLLLMDDPGLVADFLAMHREAESGPSALGVSCRVLDWLARFAGRHACPPRGRRPVVDSKAVRRAVAYIHDHVDREVTLDDIAAAAGVDRYRLIRQFRFARGLTPYGYLLQARLDRAQALLAAGRPPAEVAARTGFADQSHLTRAFRRLTGMTPGRYARDMRRER